MKKDMVAWFRDLSNEDVDSAGGKGASLAEMYNARFPIPPGFVVTAEAFKIFLAENDISERINKKLEGLNVEDTERLQSIAKEIQEIILSTTMPSDIKKEIIEAYDNLNVNNELYNSLSKDALSIIKTGRDAPFVAVRSSATAEDLPSISKDEHILVKINNNTYFRRMEEIYDLVGEGIGFDIEIPALKNNRIQWVKVGNLYKHKVKKESNLFKITTKTGREIVVSPNHTLIILDEKNLEPEKIKSVHDLKGNEKVPTINQLPILDLEKKEIDVMDYLSGEDIININGVLMINNKSNNWKSLRGLPKKLKINKDFAYFLGVYCAEGSVYKNNEIIITNSNKEVIGRIIKFIFSLGLDMGQPQNKHNVRIYNKTLLRFLSSVAGKPDHNVHGKKNICSNKRVPEFVFSWNKYLIYEFLKGYFDGEGNSGSNLSFSSSSKIFTSGVIKLLELLNLEWNLRRKEGEYFEVRIPKFYYNSVLNPIELESIRKEKNPENLTKTKILDKFCPLCENKIKVSNKKYKTRYHCKKCHKTFYGDNETINRKVSGDVNYDSKDNFLKVSYPWNKMGFFQRYSLKEFKKLTEKRDVSLNESVKWDQIKRIDEIDYDDYVYDFSVPKVQNFAAGIGGIITHNSASFAGQQATYVNVRGSEKVSEAVQKCWASLYTARAIYYRVQNNFDHSKVYIAVVVQKMVDSEKAGVMFTANPVNYNKNEIVIDAAFGLGDAVVGGEVTADNYIIDKNNYKIKNKKIGRQEWMYAKDERGQTYKKTLSGLKGSKQKLSEEEIEILARYGSKIEDHYKKPMDIEWAIEGNKVFIVQARPITTLSKTEINSDEIITSEKPVLEGLGASPGVAVGQVKILHDLHELDKIAVGDILVTTMTKPDYVVAMKRAKAIVTDEGSLTSHAAIVSREIGIPCVVGTGKATSVLKEGETVTVDGTNGDVYSGCIEKVKEKEEKQKCEVREMVEEYKDIKTKTKIYMNLGEPDEIERYKDLPFEGIGLMRIEFIISSEIRKHPMYMLGSGNGPEFISKLAAGISKVGSAIRPRPLIVRFSDFKSNEYRDLYGGNEFEPSEENPMIGWRGVSRYISEKYEKAFRLECQAIRKVRESCSNVHVMLPFVRNVWEVSRCLEIMKEEGLVRDNNFKIYIMAEVPAVALIPEEFAKLNIDGASIGSNDLTQLVLGVDRDSSLLGSMGYFDEKNSAVKEAVTRIIEGFHKYSKTVSICGQAPSVYEDFSEFLVSKGIDVISVNPDVVEKTHALVAKFELQN